MSSERPAEWTATITVRAADPLFAEWLARVLIPEASREVPRARAEVHRTDNGATEVAVAAYDSGALRAALNTYLGWVELSVATARRARRAGSVRPVPG